MASPPTASLPPSSPPSSGSSDGHSQFPLNYVIGICIGGTIGLILLVVLCVCVVQSCRRIRRRRYSCESFDLEQPLDNYYFKGASRMGFPGSGSVVGNGSMRKGVNPLAPIKEAELVVSMSAPGNLDNDDLRAIYGDGIACGGKLSEEVLRHSNSSVKQNGGPRPNAVMRWLESVDLPVGSSSDQDGAARSGGNPRSASSAVGGVSSPLPKGVFLVPSSPMHNRFATSMRSMLSRLDTRELAEMRRQLLLASATGYTGDSSAQPLDSKGVVFARLPPSRMASPAPSMYNDNASQAASNYSRRTKRAKQPDPTDAGPGDAAPEQQVQQAAVLHPRQSFTKSPASVSGMPTASIGGVAFANISSLSRNSISRSTCKDHPLDNDTHSPAVSTSATTLPSPVPSTSMFDVAPPPPHMQQPTSRQKFTSPADRPPLPTSRRAPTAAAGDVPAVEGTTLPVSQQR